MAPVPRVRYQSALGAVVTAVTATRPLRQDPPETTGAGAGAGAGRTVRSSAPNWSSTIARRCSPPTSPSMTRRARGRRARRAARGSRDDNGGGDQPAVDPSRAARVPHCVWKRSDASTRSVSGGGRRTPKRSVRLRLAGVRLVLAAGLGVELRRAPGRRAVAARAHPPSSAIGIRSCARLSRSRSVTVRSSSDWWSIVTAHGVPISSWRR